MQKDSSSKCSKWEQQFRSASQLYNGCLTYTKFCCPEISFAYFNTPLRSFEVDFFFSFSFFFVSYNQRTNKLKCNRQAHIRLANRNERSCSHNTFWLSMLCMSAALRLGIQMPRVELCSAFNTHTANYRKSTSGSINASAFRGDPLSVWKSNKEKFLVFCFYIAFMSPKYKGKVQPGGICMCGN